MSYSDKLFSAFSAQLTKNRLPIASSLFFGLLTYVFCFTNKLETMDDLACLFAQGSTLSSGRWGLDLAAYFLPSASIPWLNGILSLLFLTAAICVILWMFEIQSPILQVLLSALLISFPTQTCTFGYMFTTVPYALALLLSVLAAQRLAAGLNRKNIILALLFLVLSLSIYQVYVAVAASLLVVFAFSQTLDREQKGKTILYRGAGYIVCLIAAMVIYYGITSVIMHFKGSGLNEYAEVSLSGPKDILFGIRVAYTSFIGYFYKGYYNLINSVPSQVAHIAVAVICGALVIRHFCVRENLADGRLPVALLCIVLLPPAVNCIRIISTLFHNLMLFSFTSVYVLAAVVLERCGSAFRMQLQGAAKDLTALAMAVVLASNIYFANCVYLKMYMQFQQAESFYTTVIAQVMQDENFTQDSLICFVGDNHLFYDIPLVDVEQEAGIREGIIGTYSQDAFIRCYTGLSLNIAGWDVTDVLAEDPRVVSMPCYPDHGSIQVIDGNYVIKIS